MGKAPSAPPHSHYPPTHIFILWGGAAGGGPPWGPAGPLPISSIYGGGWGGEGTIPPPLGGGELGLLSGKGRTCEVWGWSILLIIELEGSRTLNYFRDKKILYQLSY